MRDERCCAGVRRSVIEKRGHRFDLAPAVTRRLGAGGKAANAFRAFLARRRKRLVVIREVERPVERLKLVYVPLDASEEEVASIRREHAGAFSVPVPAEGKRLTRVGT